MLHYFTSGTTNIQLHENIELIHEFENLSLFENSHLHIYNPLIDDGELETLIIRQNMKFYGKVHIKNMYLSMFRMTDSTFERDTYHNGMEYVYIYIEGLFETYSSDVIYKKFYINEN